MSFSVQERINATSKALLGNVLDADPNAQWYESSLPFGFSLGAEMIWTQADLVRANPAANLAAAVAACAGPLAGVVQDLSAAASAVRLTAVPGVNNTFIALETFGVFSSAKLRNWLKPQFAPQASGSPSFGYAARLFSGDPAAGGTEILTSTGATGTGANKSVGWMWNYDNGVLLLASDFAVVNPYIVGFRYIGTTAAGGGGVMNLDGGSPSDNFGGQLATPIDGGDPSSF